MRRRRTSVQRSAADSIVIHRNQQCAVIGQPGAGQQAGRWRWWPDQLRTPGAGESFTKGARLFAPLFFLVAKEEGVLGGGKTGYADRPASGASQGGNVVRCKVEARTGPDRSGVSQRGEATIEGL